MSTGCSTGSLDSPHTNNIEEDVPPPPSNRKYSIIVDLEGAKGSDATKWATRCGALIRSHVPIGYECWKDVDDTFKNNLWTALMKEFELNINPKIAKPILEKKFPQYYRTTKAKMRKKFLKVGGQFIPKQVAIDNRPDDIDKVWWKRFVDIEYGDKKRKQCKTNADNKAKSSMTHTLGRKSYLKLYEELAVDHPGENVTRAMAWKAAHKKKTGEVIPCASEKYALIEAAEARQKAEASLNGDDVISFEDYEKDALAEVFGDDKRKSFCRAISSTATMKQMKLTQASKAISNYKEEKDKKWKMKMEKKQDQITDDVKSMNSTMLSMQQSLLQFMSQYGGNQILRAEAASNSELPHDSPRASLGVQSNGGDGSSTRERQPVMLLSENLKDIAKGHVGTQKICHHREVLHGEKVVWVEQVLDPEAPIFKAPQNGNFKLFDIIDGGFIIWPESRLRNL